MNDSRTHGHESLGWFGVGLGGLMFVVGLIIGLWPHGNGQVQGTLFADSCGSALLPNASAVSGLVSCDYYLEQPRVIAIALLVIGGFGLAFGLIAAVGSRMNVSRKPRKFATVASELESLSALHSQGQLTDAEFSVAKARLLRG